LRWSSLDGLLDQRREPPRCCCGRDDEDCRCGDERDWDWRDCDWRLTCRPAFDDPRLFAARLLDCPRCDADRDEDGERASANALLRGASRLADCRRAASRELALLACWRC